MTEFITSNLLTFYYQEFILLVKINFSGRCFGEVEIFYTNDFEK